MQRQYARARAARFPSLHPRRCHHGSSRGFMFVSMYPYFSVMSVVSVWLYLPPPPPSLPWPLSFPLPIISVSLVPVFLSRALSFALALSLSNSFLLLLSRSLSRCFPLARVFSLARSFSVALSPSLAISVSLCVCPHAGVPPIHHHSPHVFRSAWPALSPPPSPN